MCLVVAVDQRQDIVVEVRVLLHKKAHFLTALPPRSDFRLHEIHVEVEEVMPVGGIFPSIGAGHRCLLHYSEHFLFIKIKFVFDFS